MGTRGTLRLATRRSALALRQAATIRAALEDRRYAVELVEIETTGDQIRDELIHRLGKTGAFVRSLDERVLAGDVDGAIHSMKDMPTDQPDELIVAGIPERANPGDALVTPGGRSLDELPDGAVVGTSSLRRRAQLLSVRPDLVVEPLRGNVDTRIEKLLAPHLQREHTARLDAEERGNEDDPDERQGAEDEGERETDRTFERTTQEWLDDLAEIERRALGRERNEIEYDAIVLARAGLDRSGLSRDVAFESLSPERFVPAPGQGAIAVTAVDESDASEIIHDVVDHPRTRVETTAERVVLAELGGGCIAPIGIHGVVRGEHVHVNAQVFNRDGTEVIKATRDLPIERYVETARTFAADLRGRGAADLIEAARVDADDRESARGEPENDGN